MIHGLSRIAETYNCAILLTNQVSVSMKGMFSANDAIGGNSDKIFHQSLPNRSARVPLPSYVQDERILIEQFAETQSDNSGCARLTA